MKPFIRQVITNTYLLVTLALICGATSYEGLRIYAALSLVVWIINYWHYVKPFKYRRWRKLRRNGGSHTGSEWNTLLLRQNFRCARCQQKVFLTKDHIIPVSRGGTNSIDNIQALCQACNSSKGTKIIDYR